MYKKYTKIPPHRAACGTFAPRESIACIIHSICRPAARGFFPERGAPRPGHFPEDRRFCVFRETGRSGSAIGAKK